MWLEEKSTDCNMHWDYFLPFSESAALFEEVFNKNTI